MLTEWNFLTTTFRLIYQRNGISREGTNMALKFKDFMLVDYRPGEPEEIKYQDFRQRKTEDIEDTDEALSRQGRLQRARSFRKNKAKIQRGRKIASRRMASPEKLKKRARKAARTTIFNKLSKDVPKADMTLSRKMEIEKRLESPMMKKKIDRLAVKMLKDVRKKEMERKKT